MQRQHHRRTTTALWTVAITAPLLLGMLPVAAASARASAAATLYVSPHGTGAACTQEAPCSLATAKADVAAAAPTMTRDLVVELAGGTYDLTSTLAFGPGDSGTSGHTVSFQAVPGQKPVISGGRTITGWSLHDAGLNIWQARVPAGFTARQLYVNGAVAQLAEQNSSVLGTFTQTSTGYTLSSPTLASWPRPTDTDFVYPMGGMTPSLPFSDSLCGVASVTGTTVTMQQPCYQNARTEGPNVNVPVYVENNYALLTQPGQFYIDSGTGTIYYIPRPGEKLSTARVIAPAVQTLLSVNGTSANPVHNLNFSGLGFEYATWLPPAGDGAVSTQANDLEIGASTPPTKVMMPSAVEFHSADDVTFSGNVLTHLGGGGVAFDGGGQGDSITGNVLTDIAGNGIGVGVGPWKTLGPPAALETGYTIDDNYVHDVANQYLSGVGIFAGFVADTTIDHNEVWDVPYTGISLGWGWAVVTPTGMTGNHIDYNYVHDVMTSSLYDGGGIYVNGPQSTSGGAPTIKDNFIDGDTQIPGEIYLDGGSTNWLVEDNVTAHAPATNWLAINEFGGQEGYDNTIENNYSDNTDYAASPAPVNTIADNQQGLTSWPAAAQSIMANAGLSASYLSLLPQGREIVDLARGATATASSTYSATFFGPHAAIDTDPATGWSPSATDTSPWWQVDLGTPRQLTDIQVLTRQDIDQPTSRQDFAIEVSNSPTMATYKVVCTQGSSPLPYRGVLDCRVPEGAWRYVRIATTVSGGYLFLAEVRVYGAEETIASASAPPPNRAEVANGAAA